MDMWKAWPGPCPLARVPPLPALPASHLCARILGHRDSDAQLSSPKSTSCAKGPRPEVGRSGGGAGGGAGARKAGPGGGRDRVGWTEGHSSYFAPSTLYNRDI